MEVPGPDVRLLRLNVVSREHFSRQNVAPKIFFRRSVSYFVGKDPLWTKWTTVQCTVHVFVFRIFFAPPYDPLFTVLPGGPLLQAARATVPPPCNRGSAVIADGFPTVAIILRICLTA